MSYEKEPWHLNKSVPITFIMAILCQTIALIWFVATLRSDVDNNKVGIERLEGRTVKLETVVHDQAVTLGRMDVNIQTIKDILERIVDEN